MLKALNSKIIKALSAGWVNKVEFDFKFGHDAQNICSVVMVP